MNPQNGGQKSFVNLANASDADVQCATNSSLTLGENAANTIPPTSVPVPITNVKLVSQYAPTPGSINLTITNGAVNLRPAGQPQTSAMRSPDLSHSRPTLLRANISGPGALQRLPIQNMSNQAINLKLNPINVRITGTTIAAGKVGGNPVQTASQGILRPLTLRPLTSGTGQPLVPGPPITLRPICSSGNPPIAPMPIMQAVPQSIAAQLMSQGSTTLIQTGAKFTNSMPIGQLQYMPGQSGQMGKLQMRALSQPIKIRPAMAGDQHMLASVTTTPFSNNQPINLTPVSTEAQTQVSNLPKSESQPKEGKAKVSSVTSSSSGSSKEGKVKAKRKDSVKTKLASKEAPFIKDNKDDKEGNASVDGSQAVSPGEQPKATVESVTKSSLVPIKEVASAAPGGEEKSPKKLVKEDTSGAGDEAEEEDGLVWKNGIGTLQGSDIKFRKNEFGLLEMITEEETEESSKMETEEEEKVICCCENCGIHGMAQEFLNGGRFCSRRCVGAHASKKGAASRKAANESGDGPVKRKKRKVAPSAETDRQNPPKIKIHEETKDSETNPVDTSTKKAENNSLTTVSTTTPTKAKGSKSSDAFSWAAYLDQEDAIAAPENLFIKYQNCEDTENRFKLGMRLEAIDPKHPALYCVVCVAEVRGFRLRIHFDGYSDCYDFWSNADSPFLFPAGWTRKQGKSLQPPKNYTSNRNFTWSEYLKFHKFIAAPEKCFRYNMGKQCSVAGFQVGQKLEAVDKKNSTQVCVASIVDMLEDHVLIHFDGWEDIYDYWCDPSSPYIHPVGWCEQNQVALSPPKEWKDVSTFTWEEYLTLVKAQPVPTASFSSRPVTGFQIGHKLEVIDRRNQILVRAAEIVDVESHAVTLHFDGWSDVYDYTVDDDSTDLHPCGWCDRTGHPFCPPLTAKDFLDKTDGCPTPGCTGVGHIKGAKFIGHHSAFGCPYSNLNMNKETSLHDRMGPSRPDFENGYKKSKMAELSPPEKQREVATDTERSIPERLVVNGEDLQQQGMNKPKPLFGKGSGRGRKKTIVRLMQEAEQARQQAKSQLQQNMEETTESLQQDVHSSVFTPSQIPSPYRDLPLGWEQNHPGLLPGLEAYRLEEVCDWQPKQVAKLIGQLPGCAEVAGNFLEEQIDGESLLLLNQADMVRVLNIKLGPALKIYNAVLLLKNNTE